MPSEILLCIYVVEHMFEEHERLSTFVEPHHSFVYLFTHAFIQLVISFIRSGVLKKAHVFCRGWWNLFFTGPKYGYISGPQDGYVSFIGSRNTDAAADAAPCLAAIYFYPLFEEKVGIVLLSGSEVGIESELSRRFEVPW